MRVRVESYAGRKAEERPVRFRIARQDVVSGGERVREYRVEEVIDQWYSPHEAWYKVRADDGNVYILKHQTSAPDGEWELVSFRKVG